MKRPSSELLLMLFGVFYLIDTFGTFIAVEALGVEEENPLMVMILNKWGPTGFVLMKLLFIGTLLGLFNLMSEELRNKYYWFIVGITAIYAVVASIHILGFGLILNL